MNGVIALWHSDKLGVVMVSGFCRFMARRRSVGVVLRLPFVAAVLCGVVWSGCGNGSGDVSGGLQTGGTSGVGGTQSNEAGAPAAGGTGEAGTGAGTGGSGVGGAPNNGSGGAQGSGSPGCGAAEPLESGRFRIDINGTEREYVLDVPSSYDTNHPYRLIFAWHWVDVTANDVVSGEPGPYGGLGPYYGLKALANETAIFVAPEGVDSGWLNENDVDIAFLRGMLERFNSNLCIDQGRIFSTGFSYGAMMSVAVGCEMGDVFRAIAPMSGSTGSGCNTKDSPIAYWSAHGALDTDIPPDYGWTAREIFLQRNHCEEQTTATEPSPCVAYAGCDDGYPVHWCEFDGDHTQWSNAPAPLWAFFTQF
jgi:poly(3-hydroxybutyrate) depolymerase